MNVEEVMTRNVQSCHPQDSLQRAAQLMWENDCGCIPVCSDDERARTIGVITDRDICMNAYFQGRPLSQLRVEDVMARHVRGCRPDDSVEQAQTVMREGRIRRVPVMDEQGALRGMVCLADLVQAEADQQTRTGDSAAVSDVRVTLAAICGSGSRKLHGSSSVAGVRHGNV